MSYISTQTSYALPVNSSVTSFKTGTAMSYKVVAGDLTFTNYTTANNLFAGFCFAPQDIVYTSTENETIVTSKGGYGVVLTDGSAVAGDELGLSATGLAIKWTAGIKVGRAMSNKDGSKYMKAELYNAPVLVGGA